MDQSLIEQLRYFRGTNRVVFYLFNTRLYSFHLEIKLTSSTSKVLFQLSSFG